MPTPFSLLNGATDTRVTPTFSQQIRLLTSRLDTLVADIRKGKEDLKRRLPAVCWAATFTDGRRHLDSAEWNGLAYIDVDHVSQWYHASARQLYHDLYQGHEQEYGIVHAQVSPSGDGLHLVFIPEVALDPSTRNFEKAQERFAQRTGLASYDHACKDLVRMLFLSSLADTLYDVLDILTDD